MRKNYLRVFLSLCLAIQFCVLPAQEPIHHTVYFSANHHELEGNSKTTLRQWIDSIAKYSTIAKIRISGHADNKGEADYNYLLSQKRAITLKGYFTEAGIDSAVIDLNYEGETSPIASNDTKEGRRLNRRAEIMISLEPGVIRVADSEPIVKDNFSELYELLGDPQQEFCIDVTRDTFLVGKRGTIIHYKANTIKKQNLSCACFTLKLNEYFDNSDLILNNLTTTSDGQPLESGGMIKLDGYCDGKKYELKPDEFFTVMVPTDTVLPGMKLLSANRDNDSTYLNWQLDPVSPDLEDFDFRLMLLRCGGVRNGPDVKYKCPFFFCRIGNFFRGLFGPGKRRQQQVEQSNNESTKEAMVMRKYALKGEDLAVALQKSKDNTGKDALKYYVYKNYNWDYRNIDRYKPGAKFINFIVENDPAPDTDVKIVFKNSKTVVPCFEKSKSYVFKQINEGADVWVIGLRYTTGKEIYCDIKEVNTSDKRTRLNFQPVTVEELKEKMKKINKI